jgi:Zn-dependent protease
VLTLFAGPGAGFALYGAVVAAELIFVRQGWLHNNPRRFDYLATMFRQLKFINLWWGLVNLLPVYPLDGGQISRELLMHFRGRSGLDISLKLSILVGGAAAAWFFMHDLQYAGILFALLAFESFQHLGGMRYR